MTVKHHFEVNGWRFFSLPQRAVRFWSQETKWNESKVLLLQLSVRFDPEGTTAADKSRPSEFHLRPASFVPFWLIWSFRRRRTQFFLTCYLKSLSVHHIYRDHALFLYKSKLLLLLLQADADVTVCWEAVIYFQVAQHRHCTVIKTVYSRILGLM